MTPDLRPAESLTLPVNQVIAGDCIKVMRGFPAESVNLVMFSPPYWGLRDYGEDVNSIWGGDPSCEHDWVEKEFYKDSPTRVGIGQGNRAPTHEERWHRSAFCSKCGAWRGQFGLEPTYQMYVHHLIEVGQEIKRILRRDGSWYLNLGDTYYTGQGAARIPGGKHQPHLEAYPQQQPNRLPQEGVNAKCKLLIPYRVALALIDDGWIVRNDITWFKPNAMPSSVKDRLTCQTECVFHLVKSNKTLFWTNEKTKQRVEKQPLGLKGKENIDWQWVECPSCQLYDKGEVCEACNGTGKIKRSLWQGHCYYYALDAIREPHKVESIERDKAGYSTSPMQGRYQVPWEKRDGTPDQEFCNPLGKNPGDFWPITTKPFPDAHFAVYPEALCERPIKSSCPKDGIVLDPMCGAGTTLAVAKRLGRRFIGIDLNPDYCEMARRRLGQVESPLEVYA